MHRGGTVSNGYMFSPCRPWRRCQTVGQTADKESSCARLPAITFWCRRRTAAQRLDTGDWWLESGQRSTTGSGNKLLTSMACHQSDL